MTTRESAYIPYPAAPAKLGSFAIAAASSSKPNREKMLDGCVDGRAGSAPLAGRTGNARRTVAYPGTGYRPSIACAMTDFVSSGKSESSIHRR